MYTGDICKNTCLLPCTIFFETEMQLKGLSKGLLCKIKQVWVGVICVVPLTFKSLWAFCSAMKPLLHSVCTLPHLFLLAFATSKHFFYFFFVPIFIQWAWSCLLSIKVATPFLWVYTNAKYWSWKRALWLHILPSSERENSVARIFCNVEEIYRYVYKYILPSYSTYETPKQYLCFFCSFGLLCYCVKGCVALLSHDSGADIVRAATRDRL